MKEEIGDEGEINIDQQSLVMFLSDGFLAVSSTWRNLIWRYESVFLAFRKDERPEKSDVCYYLGVAYASNLGGAGTLTGTGTNLTFKGIWDTWVYSSFGIIYHMGHDVYRSNYVILYFVPLPVFVESFHLKWEISFLYCNKTGCILSSVCFIVIIWCCMEYVWYQSLLHRYEKHFQYHLEQPSHSKISATFCVTQNYPPVLQTKDCSLNVSYFKMHCL